MADKLVKLTGDQLIFAHEEAERATLDWRIRAVEHGQRIYHHHENHIYEKALELAIHKIAS